MKSKTEPLTKIIRRPHAAQSISIPTNLQVGKKYFVTKMFEGESINVSGPCEIKINRCHWQSDKVEILIISEGQENIISKG